MAISHAHRCELGLLSTVWRTIGAEKLQTLEIMKFSPLNHG
ncbi:hypothetical protein COLO4_22309 [Corchorus olitorius]|uniref:Uncharacterized protein n=1 Tax=Corchorus olitorius TaxID=93759 RepID=A0A1R3IMY4_9ROSI|nr:hypothetical protein COLO4_22309 [Corchorus olitorius]